jgi:hypothetical protein
MRNILALVGAATVAFILVGWYLGWYQVSSTTTSQGPQSVQVDINPNKITDDVKKGVEKGEKIVDSLREQTGPDGKPVTAPGSGPAKPATGPTDPAGSSNGWLPIGGGTRPDASGPAGRRGPGN